MPILVSTSRLEFANVFRPIRQGKGAPTVRFAFTNFTHIVDTVSQWAIVLSGDVALIGEDKPCKFAARALATSEIVRLPLMVLLVRFRNAADRDCE